MGRQRYSNLMFFATTAVLMGGLCQSSRAGDTADLKLATQRGLELVSRAGANWQTNKKCFSCHHQTLPMLTMVEAARAKFPIDADGLKSQADYTHKFFDGLQEKMLAGEHIGGGAATAVYGLWALSLDRRPADDTTAAIVTYLLKIQNKDGHWHSSCVRPPLQESRVSATVLSLVYMEEYATEEQRSQLAAARANAEQWLAKAPLKSQEDRAFRLWGLHRLDGDAQQTEQARAALLAAQKPDGGWGQTDNMESDAYATGQVLFVLRDTGSPRTDPAIERAAAFLLRTQLDDGSWLVKTRVKPVQTFFENGDPHGKDQFLSTSATAWSTAALAQMLPE